LSWSEGPSGDNSIGIFKWEFVVRSEVSQISNELLIIWGGIIRIIIIGGRIVVNAFQPRELRGRRGGRRV
jgi:hypothetical protein